MLFRSKEIGINEIIIATGYLHQKFDYLKEKYGVKLVFNDKFDTYNNVYTMYLLREYLNDSFVLDGDVYLINNFLSPNLNQSTYYGGKMKTLTSEWVLKFNNDNEIVDISIETGTDYMMTGISYWTLEDGKKINKIIEEMIDRGGFEDSFWDESVKNNLKDFRIKIQKVKSDD